MSVNLGWTSVCPNLNAAVANSLVTPAEQEGS